MKEIDQNKITEITDARTKIETALAKKLYAIYDDPGGPILLTLRKVVGAAIENIIPLINSKQTNKTIVGRLVGEPEHEHLAAWKYAKEPHQLVAWDSKWTTKPPFATIKNARAALERVWRASNRWSASDCSDLIRLFGDICEKNQGKTVEYSEEDGGGSAHYEDNIRDFENYKPDNYFFAVDPGKKGKPEYEKGYERFKKKNVPISRTRASGDNKDVHARGKQAPHIEMGRKNIRTYKMGGPFYGIKQFRLMPKSTVRKVDIAFGLPAGADASGTTADSILVINRVKSFIEGYNALNIDLGIGAKGDEYMIQMLPLVTMVSLGHHTLFESALTLTYHNYINYAVGFYDTLMPVPLRGGGRCGDLVKGSGAVGAALKTACKDAGNKHMLAYYDGRERCYKGFLFESEEEIKKLKKFAFMRGDQSITRTNVDFPWLNMWRDRVSNLVTQRDLVKIGAPIPVPEQDAFQASDQFLYDGPDRMKLKQTASGFMDTNGINYKKCDKGIQGAFEIKRKNWSVAWVRHA